MDPEEDASDQPSGSGRVGREVREEECDDGFVDDSPAEEDLLDELENEDIPASIREARLAQMKQEMENAKVTKEKGYGAYSEIEKEEDVLKLTTKLPKVIIHFYHTDFRRCSIMDKHLKILAEKHIDTKFFRVNVDITAFFVKKLQIQVLPAVLSFLDGIVVDRVVGFDELGNTDSFLTETLERRIAKSGIIKLPDGTGSSSKTVFGFARRQGGDDSSDEDY